MEQCGQESNGERRPGGRLLRVWLPVAVAAGVVGALIASAFRFRPEPKRTSPVSNSGSKGKTAPEQVKFPPPPTSLEREYVSVLVLGGKGEKESQFRSSLEGIDVGPDDQIYALGDGQVKIFDRAGAFLKKWNVPREAACVAAGADGRVYTGRPGRVDIFTADGAQAGGFPVGASQKPAHITAIQVRGEEILVADAGARIIRRFDVSGKSLGDIGTKTKTGGFILPNGRLDLAVDSKGVIRATDTGRHRVSAWSPDGSPLGFFGKFGTRAPEDFVGCCNPINLAMTPDGKVVTAEKVIPRVKVFEPEGKLLGYIGPEHFDPTCTFLDLVVDSRGRILVADPVRREIHIFSPSKESQQS